MPFRSKHAKPLPADEIERRVQLKLAYKPDADKIVALADFEKTFSKMQDQGLTRAEKRALKRARRKRRVHRAFGASAQNAVLKSGLKELIRQHTYQDKAGTRYIDGDVLISRRQLALSKRYASFDVVNKRCAIALDAFNACADQSALKAEGHLTPASPQGYCSALVASAKLFLPKR
ncbi:MAG: hypothetical protein OXT65_08100 [Alphaproteobacteria bacterium]|nr:hypothetical protein [Alphaproteobacteria bacterium]